MTALSSLVVRPAIQQTNPNSPQPFVSFILPDSPTLSQTVVPILVAVALPAEISEDYSLYDIFVFAENDFVTTFPLTEEPFFDEKTNSFIWLFFGSYELSLDQSQTQPLNLIPLTLSAYALFEPLEPSSSSLSAYDEFFLLIDLTSFGGEEEQQEKESAQTEKRVSKKSDASSTGETEGGQISGEAGTSQSREVLAKEAAKKAIERDPEIARKIFEQEVVAKALSNAKKNPKSTAKGNGMVITVGAYPDVLPADGKSTAFIVAKVTDEKGKPIANKTVHFSATGGILGPKARMTDDKGIAFALLTSEKVPKRVKVKAKVNPEAETEVSFLPTSSDPIQRIHQVEIVEIDGSGDVITLRYRTFVNCPNLYHQTDIDAMEAHGYYGANWNLSIPQGEYEETVDIDSCHGMIGGSVAANHPKEMQPHNGIWTFRVTLLCLDWEEPSAVATSVDHNVENLHIVSYSPPILISEGDGTPLRLSYTFSDAAPKPTTIVVKVYDMRGNEVVEVRKENSGMKDEVNIPPLERGLYGYEIWAWHPCQNGYLDRDNKVSGFLLGIGGEPYPQVEEDLSKETWLSVTSVGEVEYYGYDDKGTEEVEDDDHLYFIRWYVLKDKEGRNASSGEVWLYDPDLQFVKRWDVRELQCLEHDSKDGLKASVDGVKHGILVPVPVNLMQKAGTYYFVLHFMDDHADKYKDHQVKPALEVNALWRGERVALVGIKFFSLSSVDQEIHFPIYSRHLERTTRDYWRQHLCPDSHPEHGHLKPYYPKVTSPPQWKRYLYETGNWKGKLTLCKYPERIAVPMGWRLIIKADIDANLSTPYIVRIKLRCEQMVSAWNKATSSLTFIHPQTGNALSPEVTITNWDAEDYGSLVWESEPLPLEVNQWTIKLKWEIWYYPQGQPSQKRYVSETNTHVIYATVNEPLSCGSEEWQCPWYTILDRVTEWAAGKTSAADALEAITRKVYDMPLFDYSGSPSHPFARKNYQAIELDNDANVPNNESGNNYLYPLLPNSRDLTAKYLPAATATAQCTDAASILIVLFRAIGVESTTRVIDGPFVTNLIDPIGNPGLTMADWNFHHLADLNTASPAGPLYDACLKFPDGTYVLAMSWDEYRNRLLHTGNFNVGLDYVPRIVKPYYHSLYRQGSAEEASL